MMFRVVLAATVVSLVVAGCSSESGSRPDAQEGQDGGAGSPLEDGGSDDAAPAQDRAPAPDAVPPNADVTVSGQLRKLGEYLAGTNTGVGEASIHAAGVQPARDTNTDPGTGDYRIALPQNGQIILYANKAGYFPTVNAVTTQAADLSGQNLFLAETAWMNAIAQANNVDLATPFPCHAPALNPQQQCIYSEIVGRVLDDGTAGNGTLQPVGGIGAADFTLAAGPQLSDQWYKQGPFFLAANGTPSAAAPATIVDNLQGGLFVFFVEIPQVDGPESISARLSIRHSIAANSYRSFGPIDLQLFRPYGVSWTKLTESGNQLPPAPGNVDFDSQIYPLLLPVTQGGLGCQGCHTNANGATPTGNMNLYGGPEIAYGALDPQQHPLRVNLQNPAASYLLVRPLYETTGPQDHPIFAFSSERDPAYQLILGWIQQGAVRTVQLAPVSFENQIRPLLYLPNDQGGIGCFQCHVNRVNKNTAPAKFFMGGSADDLYAELTTERPADNGGTGELYRINKTPGQTDKSLVLLNPLSGSPEPHPVKLFPSNADPRYQLIYRWIVEGFHR